MTQPALFTILGGGGFIGSRLAAALDARGLQCWVPARDDPAVFQRPLGHAIYCIGLSSDFRTRPFDTVEAHVCLLTDVLKRARYESFLYLSSTRVYLRAPSGDERETLLVNPNEPEDIFNLTKLTGESVCFATANPCVRVARLSNVIGNDFGSNNFLFSVLRDALRTGQVTLQTTPDSAKDYIGIDDVVGVLPDIALAGRHRLYNVASGINLSNQQVLEQVQRLTGCTLSYAADARRIVFPPISIARIAQDFGFEPKPILNMLPALAEAFRKQA
jgi:nucleoside-diphosphate-sugar epimerase